MGNPKLKDDVLYFTDNAAICCGRHAGASARYTGRDISGQRVEAVTAEAVAAFEAEGLDARCEFCGLLASIARPDGAAATTVALLRAEVPTNGGK